MANSQMLFQPVRRLFTVADLAAFPTCLPSGDIDYELDKGRLIVKLPAGYEHGSAQARFGAELMSQGEQRGCGRAYMNVGVLLSRHPDTVFGPDVAFLAASRLPVHASPEGYLETTPDLIIEILDKYETVDEFSGKVAEYLRAGVRVIWIADPKTKTIVVNRASASRSLYHESETLTADEVIPGFRLKLAKLFEP